MSTEVRIPDFRVGLDSINRIVTFGFREQVDKLSMLFLNQLMEPISIELRGIRFGEAAMEAAEHKIGTLFRRLCEKQILVYNPGYGMPAHWFIDFSRLRCLIME